MATKKITELPFINTLSGSSVFDNPNQNVVVPVVLKGTTNQITVENFSKFMSLYSATTGSAGNIFVGPQTINNSLTINGNEIVNGNVNITGRLTVNEVVAQYETASILFSTGSTKLGDQITDTHEFTGSTNITGSLNYNGVLLTNIDANTIHKLQQATQSLQVTTASLNEFSASTNAHIVGISDFTSSQLAVNLGNAIYTASVDSHIVGISTYTSSVRDTLARVHQATQSLQVATASLNQFTASQDSRNFVISQYTSSTDAHIVGISAFTSSQLAVNLTISSVTGSLIGITNGLMAFTAALDNTYATDAQLYQLYQATRSLELHSGSMIGVTNGLMAYTASNTTLNTGLRGEVDGIEAYTASLKGQAIVSSSTQVQNYDVFALNSNLYTSTGSLIGITNGLMAFTAALDSTYATDAQLYQLYQATRSIELTTGSLIGITNGLMAFTAGLDSTYATDAQLYQLYQATQSLELLSGSLIGITNGLMAFTAALDSTYATDAQLYQLYAATASLNTATGSIKDELAGIEAYTASLKAAAIVSSSTQIQNYDVFALNSNLYESTGSIKAEIAGIEAYTASLKAAAIVSSSTQIQNYDVFALNSNLYNGTGSIKGEIAGIEAYTASLKGAAIVSSSQQIKNYFTFAQTSSANTFYGNQNINGNLILNGGNSARLYETTNTNYWDVYTYTDNTLRVNYKGAGNDEIILYNDGNLHLEAAITASNFKIKTAGGGIDFSVTSNGSGTTSSELLNDYEEGSFTPVIAGGTSAGTATYTDQNGKYTKIGNCVNFRMDVIWSGHTGTGTLKITGLPFTIGQNYQSVGSVRFNQSGSANHYIAGGFIYQTEFELNQIPVGGGTPASFDITSAGDIRVSGHYFV